MPKDPDIIKVRMDEFSTIVSGDSFDFPKYTTQLINLANQNAQGTRPKVVGQMSELITECGTNDYMILTSTDAPYKRVDTCAISRVQRSGAAVLG